MRERPDETSKELLKKVLAINPGGIDQNDFYADYLAGRERRAEALRHLQALIAKVNKDME
jgi:hypothetical protein